MSEIRSSIVLSFLAFFTLVMFLLGPTAAAELGTTAAAEVVAAVVTELGTKAAASELAAGLAFVQAIIVSSPLAFAFFRTNFNRKTSTTIDKKRYDISENIIFAY